MIRRQSVYYDDDDEPRVTCLLPEPNPDTGRVAVTFATAVERYDGAVLVATPGQLRDLAHQILDLIAEPT